MGYVAVGLVVVMAAVVVGVCCCGYIKAKKTADDLIRRANELINDMDTMDHYLLDIRDQITRLSNTLDEIEKDVDVDA